MSQTIKNLKVHKLFPRDIVQAYKPLDFPGDFATLFTETRNEDLENLSFSLNRQSLFQPDCEEYISLRAAPDYEADVLSHVPRGTYFNILGWNGEFARIEFQDQQGYVSTDYIQPIP